MPPSPPSAAVVPRADDSGAFSSIRRQAYRALADSIERGAALHAGLVDGLGSDPDPAHDHADVEERHLHLEVRPKLGAGLARYLQPQALGAHVEQERRGAVDGEGNRAPAGGATAAPGAPRRWRATPPA